jgi:predicted aspartyl protease
VTANLTLDTGATNTVISRRLASSLSLQPVGTAFVQTVGSPVTAQVASLKSMRVGTAEVSDLRVIVHNFSNDPRIEGLLGMDFLGRYQVGLDSQKQVLVLTPR